MHLQIHHLMPQKYNLEEGARERLHHQQLITQLGGLTEVERNLIALDHTHAIRFDRDL